jgi:hypothetical protein
VRFVLKFVHVVSLTLVLMTREPSIATTMLGEPLQGTPLARTVMVAAAVTGMDSVAVAVPLAMKASAAPLVAVPSESAVADPVGDTDKVVPAIAASAAWAGAATAIGNTTATASAVHRRTAMTRS